jgi:predicted nucleic acid-binding protein
MGLELKIGDIVFVDTAPFIYFFERHPVYFPYVEKLVNNVYSQDARIITSIITLIEVTTLPVRMGNQSLVREYRDYLTKSNHIRMLPIDLIIAQQAALIRGQYSIKTPDAIQLATAIVSGANHIVTNDFQWKQLTTQNILTVSEI